MQLHVTTGEWIPVWPGSAATWHAGAIHDDWGTAKLELSSSGEDLFDERRDSMSWGRFRFAPFFCLQTCLAGPVRRAYCHPVGHAAAGEQSRSQSKVLQSSVYMAVSDAT
jgi:hypothetical protein